MEDTVTISLERYEELASKYNKALESADKKIRSLNEKLEAISNKYVVVEESLWGRSDVTREFYIEKNQSKAVEKIQKKDRKEIEDLEKANERLGEYTTKLENRGLIDRMLNVCKM